MKTGSHKELQFLPTGQASLVEREAWNQLRKFYARSVRVVSWRAWGSRENLEFIDPLVESWFGLPEKNWYRAGFWRGRVHPDDYDAFLAFHNGEALNPGLHSHRYRMLAEDDELIWIEEVSSVRPVTPNDRLICGMFIDVSREQELTEEVLRISNFERERLGQDLHDDFCQTLAGIACLAKTLESQLQAESSEHTGYATDITRQVNEALGNVRNLSHSLAPLQLEDTELIPCLEKLARDTEKRSGIVCQASLDPSLRVESSKNRLHIYRLCQEAIRNAIRHGNATRVALSLIRQKAFQYCLTIEDNGRGFPDRPTSSEGLGIRLMKHRSRQFGGTLNLRNSSRGGAIVECMFTVSERDACGRESVS